MAGRKPPTNPGLWTLLLEGIGLAPAPKKGKKGKRRKAGARAATQRLDAASASDPALDAIVNAPIPAAPGEESPFARYGQESGMGFADALGYEAAAAAGYAPQIPGASGAAGRPADGATQAPASPEAGATGAAKPELPFSTPGPAPAPKALPSIAELKARQAETEAATPTPGKLFNEAALDSSLDALFSGLESGLAAPPASIVDDRPPAFDEFGLSTPTPVAPAPPSAAETPPAPVVEDRPKPPPPIMPDITTPPPPAPPTTPPPAPLLSKPAGDPLVTTPREPGVLPAPQQLQIAAGVDLRGLMTAIDRVKGVAGSMVVGYDGLVIMSTLGDDAAGTPRDYLGAQATSLFAGTGVQLDKMKRGELRRLLLETDAGSMLMTAADMGILVVVSQDGQAMDVAGVLTTIAGALGMG